MCVWRGGYEQRRLTATWYLTAGYHTCYHQWCRQHTSPLAPHPARSSARQRGLPPPSSLGSLRTCLCRCSRKTCRRYGALGSSTVDSENTSSDEQARETKSCFPLGNHYICLTWAIFIEFCVAPPAWYSTLNFFTSSSNLERSFQSYWSFVLLGLETETGHLLTINKTWLHCIRKVWGCSSLGDNTLHQ